MDEKVLQFAEKFLDEISPIVIKTWDKDTGEKSLSERLDVKNKTDFVRGYLWGVLMKELATKFGEDSKLFSAEDEERLEKLCGKIRMSTFE